MPAILAFGADNQNAVSNILYSDDFGNLSSWQQAVVDEAGAAAFAIISGVGQYFPGVLTDTTPPPAWDSWINAEAVAIASESTGNGRTESTRRRALSARAAAIQTYTYDTSVANTASAITLVEIRKYVAFGLNRQPSLPSVEMVDYAAQWALNWIWNRKSWSFRKRPVTLTINTDETVTVSGATSLDSINSVLWWYDDTSGQGDVIQWATADQMSAAKATYTSTGRPIFVRAHRVNTTWTYQFAPTPDQAYTVRTEALETGPPSITTASATTPFDSYPTEFKPMILNLVLARVKSELGLQGSRLNLETAMEEIDTLGPAYEDFGEMDRHGSVVDVNGDRESQIPGNAWGHGLY